MQMDSTCHIPFGILFVWKKVESCKKMSRKTEKKMERFKNLSEGKKSKVAAVEQDRVERAHSCEPEP